MAIAIPFTSGGLSQRIARHQFQPGFLSRLETAGAGHGRHCSSTYFAHRRFLRARDAQPLVAARAERQIGRIALVAQGRSRGSEAAERVFLGCVGLCPAYRIS